MKPYPSEELERMSKREIIRLYKRTVEQFNDAVPVRHGEWWIYGDGCHCSECFYHADGYTLECMDGQFKYCPNCGAKMEVEDEEEA